MIEYKGIKWYYYHKGLLPFVAPHTPVSLSKDEQKELLKKSGALFLRWTDNWGKAAGNFWYIIKDNKPSLEELSSNTRSKVRRGLKKSVIEPVSKEIMIEKGYEVYLKAFGRYKTYITPLSKEEFAVKIMQCDNCEYWGVFVENKLVAYSENLIFDGNVCSMSVVKYDPEYLKYYTSYALHYVMNDYYLNTKNFLYINDGARSIGHQTQVQDFLEEKFKYRKAYVDLHVAYSQPLKTIVNLLYPFRKIIPSEKVKILLKQEELARENKH